MALLSRESLQELMCDKELTNPLERASFIHGFRTAEKLKENKMKLKVKKLHKNAILPTYGTAGAACFDLYAMNDGSDTYALPTVFADTFVARTGLAFDIPKDYVMLVYSRSGHGFKENIRLANCVGVIDSDYTGEVMVKLTRDSDCGGFVVNHGDRIAQAMLIPVNQVTFEEVEELKETERGSKGFGSTGA